MNFGLFRTGALILFAAVCFVVFGADIHAAIPRPTGLVNDFAGVLDDGTVEEISQILEKLDRRTGLRMAVAVVETAGDSTPGTYAERMYARWGVGDGENGGGALLAVVADKNALVVIAGEPGAPSNLRETVAGSDIDQLLGEKQFDDVVRIGVERIVRAVLAERGIPADEVLAGFKSASGIVVEEEGGAVLEEERQMPWKTLAIVFSTMFAILAFKMIRNELDGRNAEDAQTFGSSSGEGFGGGLGGFRGGMNNH